MQACLYQALSKVLLFSRNLEKLGLNTACPVSQVLGSLGMKTTSLEVYQDSNTLCRLTATVVFLSRGNRIPIKISRCSAFRMAVSVVTRHAPRREPLTFNSLHSWRMWEFSFTGRFTTNQTRCAGYWTAQHISTATCRTRNDDRGACEKKKHYCGWSLCVFECRQWCDSVIILSGRGWLVASVLGGALRETRWDKTLGAVQNTRLCVGSTSTLAMWQRIAYLHYARLASARYTF